MSADLFGFQARSLRGETLDLARYRGQVVLVVNTASRCGFTPQLAGLERLYRQHREAGLVVLGFPCNQFGQQEPGDEASIAGGCVLNYGVTFPMFAKIEVKGAGADPLYQWLSGALPGLFGTHAVKWNFTKFLLDREGRPVRRFSPLASPARIERALTALLDA